MSKRFTLAITGAFRRWAWALNGIALFLQIGSPALCLKAQSAPLRLSQPARTLIELILKAAVNEERHNSSGTPSKFDWEKAERHRLARLLRSRRRGSDEAIAALVGVYLGEDPGEHVDEAVLGRGRRMLPWLKRFRAQEPQTGLEPLPERFHLNAATRTSEYDHLIHCIEAGVPLNPPPPPAQ